MFSIQTRSVASKTLPRRFDSVSSGPKMRKFGVLGIELQHIAQVLTENFGRLHRLAATVARS